MSVHITGPILSALLFEHCNADGDREGLLIGKVTTVVTKKISDSDMSIVEHQTVYNVYSFLPFPGLCIWRDGTGSINKDVLANMLHGCDAKEVLGWYKLRRNSSLSVSLRERAISRHVSEWLRQVDDTRTEIIFMLCVSRTAEIYTCDHRFMAHSSRGIFVGLPETVISLADVAQPNYQHGALHVSSDRCTYNKVLSKSRSVFIDDTGESSLVSEINRVTTRLHHKLHSLCGSVIDSEMQIAKELAELRALRRKVEANALLEHEAVQNAQTQQFSKTLPSNLRLARKQLPEDPQLADAQNKIEPSSPSSMAASDGNLFTSDDGVPTSTNCSQSVIKELDGDDDNDKSLLDGAAYAGVGSVTPNTSILDADDCNNVQVPCLLPKANSVSSTASCSNDGYSGGIDRDCRLSLPAQIESVHIDGALASETIEQPDALVGDVETTFYVANKKQKAMAKSEPFEFVSEIIKTFTPEKSATLPRRTATGAGQKNASNVAPAESMHSYGSQNVGSISSRHKAETTSASAASVVPDVHRDKDGNQFF